MLQNVCNAYTAFRRRLLKRSAIIVLWILCKFYIFLLQILLYFLIALYFIF
uniref:Uncharacterized protein n=1 Tax=Ascaris lumbricoides TaxID=6252 RepID=A0A0M3I359_ASCLU